MYTLRSTLHTSAPCSVKVELSWYQPLIWSATRSSYPSIVFRDASVHPQRRSTFSQERVEPPSQHECQRIVCAAVFYTLVRPPHTDTKESGRTPRQEATTFNTTYYHAYDQPGHTFNSENTSTIVLPRTWVVWAWYYGFEPNWARALLAGSISRTRCQRFPNSILAFIIDSPIVWPPGNTPKNK